MAPTPSVIETVDQVDVENSEVAEGAPMCNNSGFLCHKFFEEPSNAIYVAYIIFRFILYTFILFLSTRIPKDFLKNFTLIVFIPLFFAEFARLGIEIVFYLQHYEVSVEASMRMIFARDILELCYFILSDFAYYVFLTESIVVYYGLFKAFLDPDGYEKCKIGPLFYSATIVPIIIVALTNIPWSESLKDVKIYVKHMPRLILGLIMIPCYLGTVFRLSCRKQIRDTKIDDRSIIRLAKSRLIWYTVYMTFQNIVNIPGFFEAILYQLFWVFPSVIQYEVELPTPEGFTTPRYFANMSTMVPPTSSTVTVTGGFLFAIYQGASLLASICDEFRGVGLTICTLLFVPVYRESIFFCRKAPLYLKSPVLDLSDPKA